MKMSFIGLIVAMVFFGLLFVPAVVGSILFFSGRPRSGVRRVGGSMMLVCGGFLSLLFLLRISLFGLRNVSPQRQAATRTSVVPQDWTRQQEQAERQWKGKQEEIAKKFQLRQDETNQKFQRLQEAANQEWQRKQHQVVSSPTPPTHPTPPHPPQAELKAESEANVDVGLTRLPDGQATTSPVDALKPSKGGSPSMPTDQVMQPPEWIRGRDKIVGDISLLVLSSKQYSTVDEARQELANWAKGKLSRDFQNTYHASATFVHSLPLDELKSIAVRKEFIEKADYDFGNFTAPMHRVWWQVELSPEVRTKLRAIWKEQTQDQRTWTVAGTFGGITVLLAGLSLLTRRRHAVMG